MNIVKTALLQEGFADPGILQNWKADQVFGLVKPADEKLELHVRGYRDFTLDSEIELSREYLEHPQHCQPYYGPLFLTLSSHAIPYQVTRYLPPDPPSIVVPSNPTPWKPLAALAGIAVAGIALSWVFGKDDDDED